jgi:hypothetical protein
MKRICSTATGDARKANGPAFGAGVPAGGADGPVGDEEALPPQAKATNADAMAQARSVATRMPIT